MRRRWVNVALLVLVVGLFAVPLGLRMNIADTPDGAAYAGTDSSAATAVGQIDPTYRPWFSPLFAPSSKEIESGLFALQAALGAGVFGFALGRLSARGRRPASSASSASSSQPVPGSAGPPQSSA